MNMNAFPPGTEPLAPRDLARIVSEHHQIMRQFLQTQEAVMTAYLVATTDGAGKPLDFEYSPSPDLLGYEPRPAAGDRGRPVDMPAPPIPAAPVAPAPRAAKPAAPALEPPPARASPAPAPSTDFRQLLLGIVSDRTGYPPDMLGLDQDLESDLGIDSIKKVEILGALQKKVPPDLGERLAGRMQALSSKNTLRTIIGFVEENATAGREPALPFELPGEAEERVCGPLPRYVIRPQTEPADDVSLEKPASGHYLITQDDRGVADALAARLTREGCRPLLIPREMALAEDLAAWWNERRGEGRLRALLHLAPLDRGEPSAEGTGIAEWRRRTDRDIKALFPLLALGESELRNGGRIIAASACGGWFGRNLPGSEDATGFWPQSGGVVGLIKSLSMEWPDARCKAIDLDASEPPDVLAEHLFRELFLPGGRREAGYPQSRRTIFRTIPASLIPGPQAQRIPTRDWVVLATGGARGITAETLRDFAAAGCILVLVGRSPLPGEEAADTRGLAGAADLRRRLVAEARGALKPIEIERRIKQLFRERELRFNIDAFKAAGARVDYRIADLTDEAEVDRLMDGVYADYGRIDAVLHGAGLIEDQLAERKSADSVDRVVAAKLDSAFLVTRRLRPDTLRFLAFFTSVAGRYGNAGQTDYSAANEALNRLAWQLQAKWGPKVKVSAINWGPWAGTESGPGMVTDEVRRKFEERGVVLVEPEQGRRFLMRELLHADWRDVEVVAGLSPWEYVEAARGRLPNEEPGHIPPALTLLSSAALVEEGGRAQAVAKTIDLVTDPYLDHHRIDGFPVMPFAGALEHLVEAPLALGLGDGVSGVEDVKLFKGLVVTGGELPIRIDAAPSPGGNAAVSLWREGADKVPAYRGIVKLGARGEPFRQALRPVRGEPLDVGMVYERWLFHGPIFQTVREIPSIGPDHVQSTIATTPARAFYPPATEGRFILDPGLIDGAFQLIAIWARAIQGKTALPLRISRLDLYGDEPMPATLDVRVDILTRPEEPEIHFNWTFVDGDGLVRIAASDVVGISDTALNRLGGQWAYGVRQEAAE